MFTWTKVPAWGLRRATRIIDDAKFNIAYTSTARLSISHSSSTRKPGPAKERQRAEREQLTRLLKESPGKRDARNFLKHFELPKKTKTALKPSIDEAVKIDPKERRSRRRGVNFESLYQPTVFTRDPVPEENYNEDEQNEPLHLALIKLREPQLLDDETLGGIAMALSQMERLGLSAVVVLDCDEDAALRSEKPDLAFESTIREQALRFKAALEDCNEPGALLIEHVLSFSTLTDNMPSTVQAQGLVEIQNNNLMYPPIENGMIPIIMPFAYNEDFQKTMMQADEVVLALIREFSGITGQINDSSGSSSHEHSDETHGKTLDKPILDRIIILDPLGGVPSEYRADGAHAFVNLQAEYSDIREELQKLLSKSPTSKGAGILLSLGSSNPISKLVEEEVSPILGPKMEQLEASEPNRHMKNLDVFERGLRLLPPSSSGLILTPSEAAARLKNPLLHNLLTDKPMVSSSLPASQSSRSLGSATPMPATFLKKGISLTMVPDPRTSGPWQPPSASNPSVDLASDPRINLPKLIDLINDSFRRKIDPMAYLDRIHGRLAGVIITGDYEGGAICTWETPSYLLDTPPPEGVSPDSPYWIPYLDKFAVLTSSQGSGGVSDIVWAALTRTCFPNGLVWRSRTSNPVNKWYQERAEGMWNLPGGDWTMFWTIDDVGQRQDGEIMGGKGMEKSLGNNGLTRWDAYVDVCSGIQPSWVSAKSKEK